MRACVLYTIAAKDGSFNNNKDADEVHPHRGRGGRFFVGIRHFSVMTLFFWSKCAMSRVTSPLRARMNTTGAKATSIALVDGKL